MRKGAGRSEEARGLEDYLIFAFFYFSFFFLIREDDLDQVLRGVLGAVFLTDLLVYYQKIHCFPKIYKKRILGKSLARCTCAGRHVHLDTHTSGRGCVCANGEREGIGMDGLETPHALF